MTAVVADKAVEASSSWGSIGKCSPLHFWFIASTRRISIGKLQIPGGHGFISDYLVQDGRSYCSDGSNLLWCLDNSFPLISAMDLSHCRFNQ